MSVEQAFTFQDLKRILVDRVGLAEENVVDEPTAKFEDMGLDSLAFVEIQLAMQQEYGFTIPDEDASSIETVGEAIDYVNRKIAEGD
jgi:acyl carrier protein